MKDTPFFNHIHWNISLYRTQDLIISGNGLYWIFIILYIDDHVHRRGFWLNILPPFYSYATWILICVDAFSRYIVGHKIYPNDIRFSFLVLKVWTYFQYTSGLVTWSITIRTHDNSCLKGFVPGRVTKNGHI